MPWHAKAALWTRYRAHPRLGRPAPTGSHLPSMSLLALDNTPTQGSLRAPFSPSPLTQATCAHVADSVRRTRPRNTPRKLPPLLLLRPRKSKTTSANHGFNPEPSLPLVRLWKKPLALPHSVPRRQPINRPPQSFHRLTAPLPTSNRALASPL
ncbi:hypothetical protein D1007_43825 [Hordeum vulgare]|nr:hypothetical protein D1007_43825 [Hordeum vulgare]